MFWWLVVFVSIWLAALLFLWPRQTVDPVQERLAELRKEPGAQLATMALAEPEPARPKVPLKERVRAAFVRLVEQVAVRDRRADALARKLRRAGLRWRPGEFLGLQVVLSLGLAAVLTVFIPGILTLLLGVGAGWALPLLWLKRKTAQRAKEFNAQLAEAIGMLANSLRSGYSFLQAMDVVGREMPDPIASEFGQVLRENRLNIPLETALQGMVQRVPSDDLELLVTAVVIQRQVGGNLSEILDRIQGTIRDRIRLQGQIRTLTTQGRMSGWIVSLLPAGLLGILSLLNPQYVKPLFQHPVGWVLLGVAVVMQGIGMMVIRRMVDVEV
jgi:tight adherence protein B